MEVGGGAENDADATAPAGFDDDGRAGRRKAETDDDARKRQADGRRRTNIITDDEDVIIIAGFGVESGRDGIWDRRRRKSFDGISHGRVCGGVMMR